MIDKIKMRDGNTMLIMVKGGEVIHFTPNMSLPHSEFVERTTRELPAGAWEFGSHRGAAIDSSGPRYHTMLRVTDTIRSSPGMQDRFA